MQIRPLSQTSVHWMRDVFEEEIECWRRTLHWDYRPSAALIEKYMASQSLPGFVLLQDQRCVGYTYQVAAKPVGFIGNLFVRSPWATPDSYRMLLDAALGSLKEWAVSRIECQIFPFNLDTAPLFVEAGFEAKRRFFLTLDLRRGALQPPRPIPPTLRLVPWNRTFFEAAARAVHDSYLDSPDHKLCFDYQSIEGCARFLRNLIDNPGCGSFDSGNSLLCIGPGGDLCAVLITTRISAETGMIPQVSVMRQWQGRGIGSLLLGHYFARAARQGLSRVTLSVSESNRGAHELYLRLGFGDPKSFYAFVWQS